MRHVLELIARENLAPVAIYGAGAHTSKVIRALLETTVRVAGFIDASREKQKRGVCGWRVVAPETVDQLGARSVVINSDRYERRIWAGRGDLERRGLRVFRLYPEEAVHRVLNGRNEQVRGCTAGADLWDKLSRSDVHEYWRSRGATRPACERPPGRDERSTRRDEVAATENAPENYLSRIGWSVLAAEWLESTGIERHAPIIELGSNVGRNLAYFHRRGFVRLTGIELNPTAVSLMGACFPETAALTKTHVGAIEDVLPECPDDAFEACVTMGTFMCVHPSSEAVFGHVSRVTRRYLLTIEDETNDGPRYCPRNYARVFDRLGWRELRSLPFHDAGVESKTLLGLQSGFVIRLMTRR